MIEIISATRLSEDDFWEKSALGLSLRRFGRDDRFIARIIYSNTLGLSELYNFAINATDTGSSILVFMHDDVWIDDFFFIDRINKGLEIYDVIGVAGNSRRSPNQPAWNIITKDDECIWDNRENLRGLIAQGQSPFGDLIAFGPSPADCELLDGLFLAATKAALIEKGVCFDPQFTFHFYDMDFCRTARQKGLRVGTWPICLTHQSPGEYGSALWTEKYRVYIEKWGN